MNAVALKPSRDLVRHLSRFDLSEAAVMAIDLRTARASMIPFRVAEGFVAQATKLLTAPNENLKLTHSESDRVAAFGLSLAPADLSGEWNVCRYAGRCREACLATSGNGRYGATQRGRVWKTRWLATQPLHFLRVLVDEIDRIKVDAWSAAGWTVSFRFNVLSDLPWESIAPWLVQRLADRGIRCYDYSKWPTSKRADAASLGYEVCQSVHEHTTDAALVTMPHPVVVVDIKRGKPLPATYMGRPVVDGDRSDARFLDPAGSVVLLRFKNVSTTDRVTAVASGFVRSVA
jgi:hypothetical protein